MLPRNLILIRHGESIGNVALNAAKKGDLTLYTDDFVNYPDNEWTLSGRGRHQAEAIGNWLNDEIISGHFASGNTQRYYYVSPLTRTRETAGRMNILENGNSPEWRLNRSIRERDYGEVGTLPHKHFYELAQYANSAAQESRSPLYWRPPNGESIADVAENRVRNFFSTLHRERGDSDVVAVTHGEYILAALLVLFRADDQEFLRWKQEKTYKAANCEAFHFTRINPATGDEGSYVRWLRRACPILSPDGTWTAEVVSDWEEIKFHTYSNEELLSIVA